ASPAPAPPPAVPGPGPGAPIAGPPERRIPEPREADVAGRPQLPRRRKQEHIVPELREAPRARDGGGDEEPVHNPGLMAAFQRGVGRAEAEEHGGGTRPPQDGDSSPHQGGSPH
ncbi:ATP-binding protein, partial [Streptomyces oryzae]|nr:ATP-binding protein [Streptomyces oryzae]